MSEDIETIVEGTNLKRCRDCGRVFQKTHTCGETVESGGREIAEVRHRLRDMDRESDRTSGDELVLSITGRSGTAYHRRSEAEPERPWCESTAHENEFGARRREAMWDTSRYPCTHCHPWLPSPRDLQSESE